MNNLIHSSVQKGFLTGVNGTFEHIFSVSAILDNALHPKLPLAMTFIDLKMHLDLCLIVILIIFKNTSVFQWKFALTYLLYILCYLVLLQSKSGRPIPSQSAVESVRVILCPLSFSWWLLTQSSKFIQSRPLSGFCLRLLLSTTTNNLPKENSFMYVLWDKSQLKEYLPRSLASLIMAMYLFATRRVLSLNPSMYRMPLGSS